MATTARLTDPRNRLHLSTITTKESRQRGVRLHGTQAGANLSGRQFNPVTVGFWLGGLVLGMAGAIVGACLPYRHPVAVTMSILWWAIYSGCFGASIGALFGLWRKRTRIPSGSASAIGSAADRMVRGHPGVTASTPCAPSPTSASR
jgi:hypothetical protein